MFAFQAKDTGSIPVGCIFQKRIGTSTPPLKVPLAHLVEHYISNVKVVGSIPTGSIHIFLPPRTVLYFPGKKIQKHPITI